MKNLFLGAITLILFAIAFSLVQISCSKTNAQTNSENITQLDKIIYAKDILTGAGGVEVWTANYDGTNQTQIPVALPADLYISGNNSDHSLRLSPDGQTIFFVAAYLPNPNPAVQNSIYACNIDGSNVRLVVQGGNPRLRIGGAY